MTEITIGGWETIIDLGSGGLQRYEYGKTISGGVQDPICIIFSSGGVLNVGLSSTFLRESERGAPESKDTKQSRGSADCDPVMIGLEVKKTVKRFELFHFSKNSLSLDPHG